MTGNVAIKVAGVSKTFRLPHEKVSSVKHAVVNFYKRKRTYEKQRVLDDVSFEIKEGEFFGIVGRNGSGKSTLLKLLAGIYTPSQGSITVNGKLTPFIELGVGFNPELSGRENVFLNGALLGFSRQEMADLYNDIVAFAELEKFMDQKLKNYSSGMQVRLAFSIAIRAQGDILLLDEVLAVGDALFQKKCYEYFHQLKKDKRTVVFVSHDTNALLQYCDQAILIESGKIVTQGPIEPVVRNYLDILNEQEAQEKPKEQTGQHTGTGEMVVTKAVALDAAGKPKRLFTDADKTIKIRIDFRANQAIEKPVYGITINNAAGQRIFQSNTLWSKLKTKDVQAGEATSAEWEIPNVFNGGTFSISPAAADQNGANTYDWFEDAASFKVSKQLTSTAYANVEHQIVIKSKTP